MELLADSGIAGAADAAWAWVVVLGGFAAFVGLVSLMIFHSPKK